MFEKLKYEFYKSNSMARKLVLINVIVFISIYIIRTLMYFAGTSDHFDEYIFHYLAMPTDINSAVEIPWTIFTYMFMHAGFMHILFNMLWLFWMGNNFQDYLGNRRLLSVYIWGGLTGGLLVLLCYNTIPIFENINVPLVGASASIYAIVCATATLLPDYEVSVFGLFYIRLRWVAAILILLSFINISNENPGGNISHLGGALFGYLYIKAIYSKMSWWEKLKNMTKKKPQPKYKPRMKVYETGNTYIKPNSNRKPSQDEIDIILDKINASGYESLNQAEKDLLFKASHDDD